MNTIRNIAFSLTAALALTACGSKPSDEQAKKAITAEFERVLGSQVWVKEYRDFSLSGCKKSETAEGDLRRGRLGGPGHRWRRPGPAVRSAGALFESVRRVDRPQALRPL